MQPFTRFKSTLLCSSIALLLTACGSDSVTKQAQEIESDTVISIDYQNIINNTVSEDIPGVILLVETPQKKFIGSAGVENKESQNPIQVYHTMPTGSAGKPMIGLLTAMLADEGLLELDDTLDTWLSDEIMNQIPNGSEITLRQLLNHTSGIFNYVDNDNYLMLLLNEPDKLKTDVDFLALGLNHSASSKPGISHKYSNTGYLLTGLILDEVLGEHHSVMLRTRILEPLGMNNTYYRGIEKNQQGFISGYHTFEDINETYDTKAYQENIAVASSPVVSTVEEMALFMKSVVSDQSFLNDSIRAEVFGAEHLVENDNNGGYGLGIIVELIKGDTAYYHGGLIHGYHTQNVYVKEKALSITAFINCSTEPSCESTMDDLIKKILVNEFK